MAKVPFKLVAEQRWEALENLNLAFDFIKVQLEEYLDTIKPVAHQSLFSEIFNSPIYKYDIIKSKWEGNIQANNIMITLHHSPKRSSGISKTKP